MWFGIISRNKAEYFMGAPALAGGFVATDLRVGLIDADDECGFLAAIPFEGQHGRQLPKAKFRALLVQANASMYIGVGEPGANSRGFATDERIANLLTIVDGCEER